MVVQRITMKKAKPVILVILDGFGYSSHTHYNAIAQAKKPFLDFAFQNFPHTLLEASGAAVGLPAGYAGNSEVGHTTLGAGRRIPSPFLQFEQMIANKSFFSNPVLISHLQKLAKTQQPVHILGLLSDAGTHGHIDIIKALIKAALEQRVPKIIIHAFLDGRDVAPYSAPIYLRMLQKIIDEHPLVQLGSITGRFYAMDRNQNWDRTLATYTMLIQKQKPSFDTWSSALEYYYHQGISDEFIPPTLLHKNAIINDCDGIIFANFRPERELQLFSCFENGSLLPASYKKLKPAFIITAVRYNPTFSNPVLLEIPLVTNTLKQIINAAGKSIFTIAETEKSAHVTFFFDGSREQPFPGETRLFIPSPAVANFAQTPEMSAQKITDAVLASLQTNPADFYLINYANADMVGHSGNMPATIKAIECLDAQLKQLYDQLIIKMDGTLIITADHGKAENMIDEKTGQPNPAHTTNKVPFILIKNDLRNKKTDLPIHELADVAQLVLKKLKG